MPVWHEATLEAQNTGRFQMIGIVEEQHGDRAALFMQWKNMDWPILVDSLDLLGVNAVPITVFIDGQGIVRKVRAAPDDLEEFLAQAEEQNAQAEPTVLRPDSGPNVWFLRVAAEENKSADAWRDYADALLMWEGEAKIDQAIQAYQNALTLEPDNGATSFHLGVALRRRYESPKRQPGDFAGAIEHWQHALAISPNQYIWRRRIQQYGPRLDKPYSFYDWIHQARDEITARGDTPEPLRVEPRGAEFANPSRTFDTPAAQPRHPDPQGKVTRDENLITIETTIVKATPGPQPPKTITARVHVVLTPLESSKAHWNNEAEPLELWIDVPENWSASDRRIIIANPEQPTSTERREVEFEVQGPADDSNPHPTIIGSAFYNVCEDVDGQCLYRRQDFKITID